MRLWATLLLLSTCKDHPAPTAPTPVSPAQVDAAPAAAPRDENARIESLLQAISSSGLVFIRNDTPYGGAEAAAHLRSKWQAAGSRIRTAEDFVDQVGSVSSTTGKPYRVRLPDGRELPAGEWMKARLSATTTPAPVPATVPAAPRASRTPDDVLAILRGSSLVFLRVESDEVERHSGASLAARIALKYELSQSPTLGAHEFIDLFCTRSLLHGTEYLVELPDKRTRPLGDWLNEQL